MNPGDQQFINFEDYSSPNAGGSVHVDLGTPNQQQQLFGGLQNDPVGAGMMQQDSQDYSGQKDPNAPRSFWTIEYYQKYFDVCTNDVVQRLKKSMLPVGVDNFLLSTIRPHKPDLYGPFWVCITLIFAIGISGNIANYFQYAMDSNFHWKYEFHIVSQAASCIFMYAWFLPLLLWGCLMWSKSQEQQENQENELIESNSNISLLELICLYGYSLTIFIPVAFLWTIQYRWLQWLLTVVATILSGGVLLKSLMPVIPGKHKLIYCAFILGMHVILAVGFMMYFFHVPSLPVNELVSSTTTTTTTTTVAPKINQALNASSVKAS